MVSRERISQEMVSREMISETEDISWGKKKDVIFIAETISKDEIDGGFEHKSAFGKDALATSTPRSSAELKHQLREKKHDDVSKEASSRDITDHDSFFSSDFGISDATIASKEASNVESKRSLYVYIDDIENIVSDSTDISQQSAYSYIEQKELMSKTDFFDDLGTCPNLDDVASDEGTKQLKSNGKTSHSETRTDDLGRFVDPITGGAIEVHVEEEQMPEEEQIPEESVAISSNSVSAVELDEDDELLKLLEVDLELEPPKQLDYNEVFENLLTIDKVKPVKVEEGIDAEELQRVENMQQIATITGEFLHELITTVVDRAEYIDPTVILRKSLDKEELIKKLTSILEELEVEQRVRGFLNRKAVEFFRRKKILHAIREDNPEVMKVEMEKLKFMTEKLDQLLNREEEIRFVMNTKITENTAELEEAQTRADQMEIEFANVVKQSCTREKMVNLPQIIEGLINRMAMVRNEMSTLRLNLILKQHKTAALLEKLNELEYIGEGFYMSKYESLQTEIQALGKKLDERNTELSRVRIRCNQNVHLMTHMKEKQQNLRNTVNLKKRALAQLQIEKREQRERLFASKMTHNALRNEIQELSFQCGLLDKPALMLDFDTTSDRVVEVRTRIEQMHEHYNDMLQKIEHLADSKNFRKR